MSSSATMTKVCRMSRDARFKTFSNDIAISGKFLTIKSHFTSQT